MTAFLNVYLDGVLAGQLAQTAGGALAFAYDSSYTARTNPTPLSLSMPLSGSRHSNRVVSAWLEGLLPDNLAVREEWGRTFEVSPRNPFALLRHVGRDAVDHVEVEADRRRDHAHLDVQRQHDAERHRVDLHRVGEVVCVVARLELIEEP